MIYDGIVVGGGASGMMAAITAASKGRHILILERMDKLGKKILATGNGRCNLTNGYLDQHSYRGENPHFPYPLIEKFGQEELIDFFQSLGMIMTELDGYYYPSSFQATTVVDVLVEKIRNLSIDVICDFQVDKCEKDHDIFCVYGNGKQFKSKNLILSTGGKAQENLGSNGSGYKLAKGLSHKVTDTFPALVGLEADGNYFKSIAGVRNICKLAVVCNDQEIALEQGEVQFTKYGISGIPVFQISRYVIDALRRKKKVTVVLDLLPNFLTLEETVDIFMKQCPYKSIEELFQGFINKKLVSGILKRLNINGQKNIKKAYPEEISRMIHMIQNFTVDITGYKDFDMAQITAGGVSTDEVIGNTLESKRLRGLFFTGELLDVDGTCGGYNLQWAFTSGYIAGRQIGES